MINEGNSSLGEPVYSRVTDNLRFAIVTGEFEPGERLKMSDLIVRFGISKIPIREALQQLQGEGLVTILPHRGAQVRSIDKKFISNLYDIRTAIGSLLVKKACEKENLDWIGGLKAAQEDFLETAKNKEIAKIINANQEFHRVHNLVADNEEAVNILKRTESLIIVLRSTYGYPRKRLLQVVKEHEKLIECFENSDIEGALLAHENHCENAKINMLEDISNT